MIFDGPTLDQIPSRIERRLIIEQPNPKRGQRADAVPRSAIAPAHFKEAFQPHFGKGGRKMVVPVAISSAFRREARAVFHPENRGSLARRVDIFPVAENEIHRHIERVIGIALIAETVFKYERQHAGAVRIGIGPDMAAVRKEAVRLAFSEGRIGKQRGPQAAAARGDTRNFFTMSASDE